MEKKRTKLVSMGEKIQTRPENINEKRKEQGQVVETHTRKEGSGKKREGKK